MKNSIVVDERIKSSQVKDYFKTLKSKKKKLLKQFKRSNKIKILPQKNLRTSEKKRELEKKKNKTKTKTKTKRETKKD